MKENQRNRSGMNEQNTQNEPMRNTENENRRDVGQERSNESLRDAEQGSGRSYDYGTQGSEQTEGGSANVGGSRQSGNRETMAGTADMKDDQVMGRGRDIRRQAGSGSGLAPKTGVTGSDFDGQNSI